MKKNSMHGKMIKFEKTYTIMEQSWNSVKTFEETTRSQKTNCQTHKFVCLTASFLASGGLQS